MCMTRTCKCKFVLKITCDFYRKDESRLFSLQVASCCWAMPHLRRIIRMWQQGKKPVAIVRELAPGRHLHNFVISTISTSFLLRDMIRDKAFSMMQVHTIRRANLLASSYY